MIGGLIENQDVRNDFRDHCKGNSRFLSSTEGLDRPPRHVLVDPKPRQLGPQRLFLVLGIMILHDLERSLIEVKLIEMMLREHRTP